MQGNTANTVNQFLFNIFTKKIGGSDWNRLDRATLKEVCYGKRQYDRKNTDAYLEPYDGTSTMKLFYESSSWL